MKPVLADGQFRAIDFMYTFVAPQDRSSVVVALPNEWGGERELFRAWHALRVEGAGAHLEAGSEEWQRKLTFTPGAEVRLSYRIIDEGSGARKQRGNDFRAKIAPSYFQLLGNAVVPQISGMPLDGAARFTLDALPTGMRFASDLEHGAMGRNMTVADLIDSVMVGGDFRVIEAGERAPGVRLAIRGNWPRSDAEWRAQFSRIALAQRDFWGSGSEPYLVTILDLPDMGLGSVSTGGTGRSDAFAFFSTTNAPAERLDQTMAHEMMHTWVPRRIGRLPLKDEQLQYWLSEGFTDWASWRANMLGGLWRAEDFARAFNESLKAYESSPARTAANRAILEGFWRDANLKSLPYQRGMLIATYWDAVVRRRTQGARGFDDVLREMKRLADRDGALRVDRDLALTGGALDNLRTAMHAIAKHDIRDDLARFIDAGEPVPLAETVFAPCGTLATITRKTFHRGFDVEATLRANNVIQGVHVDGPAFAAGMRDGMKLIGRSAGVVGDSREQIAYDVMDGESKRTLRYLPEGVGEESVREFVLRKRFSDAERAACDVRLGAASR
jgi:predicted metalloprotease with PDZ domain